MLPGTAEQRGIIHENIEDGLGASPPLELRRPSPSPRNSTAVPHSLQSPGGDRATGKYYRIRQRKSRKQKHSRVSFKVVSDSPQVYIHSARIPHPHFSEAGAGTSRYYDVAPAAASRQIPVGVEPPPAHHRPIVTSLPPNATSVVVGSAAGSSHTQLTPPPPAVLSHLQQQREREQREREQRERERERISIPGESNAFEVRPF
jgi:hypothetical protein